ncbi:uncharacterized protein KY384_008260 [Bacidia gigantensis]|uniref:uncharacterized protein n=1 Tax=Bacidia gigantensis TaxID=2732470 RepID=UPI001D047032|nr:uncharacterized protein KY384_008260 [Bacidia gigantensis]KAG8526831.1 hypothetical protein KY384_008260 [Bacidia gigantensis]
MPQQRSTLGSALLRDYKTHLDPLNTDDVTTMPEEEKRVSDTRPPKLSAIQPDVAQESKRAGPTSPSRGLQSPKPFLKTGMKQSPTPTGSHRSILRSLAARSSQESLRQDRSHESGALPPTSFAARFLHTPCFLHQRFEDAVNVDRVLEEIAMDDDGMSHTRLMQTATSVREISKQLQRRPIKRAVRTVMIVTKARDNRLVFLTREIVAWLLQSPRYGSNSGVTVYVDAKLRKSKRFDASGLIASNPLFEQMLHYWTPDLCISSPEKFDLVLTLGGDGTVLYTSWLFQRIVPPIMSFSLGTLGFLTNFAFGDYKPTLDRIMEGSGMRVNMRMRFTCTIYRASRLQSPSSKGSSTTNLSSAISDSRIRSDSSTSTATSLAGTPPSTTAPSSTTSYPPSSPSDLIPESTFEVLNELVLDRGPSPYVSNLELYGDMHLLTIIQADGIIISTPTGSTAYSLSAGGPLTHPSIPGILLTPICPHTLSFRPMVLSDTLMLRLVVPRHSRGGAYASFDGKGRVELRRGDEVRVEVGRYPFPTVVGDSGTGGEWFESVRRALRWNTRGAVQGGFGSRVNRGIDEAEEDVGVEDIDGEELEGGQEEAWDIDAEPLDESHNSSAPESVAGGGSDTGSVLHTSPRIRKSSAWVLD